MSHYADIDADKILDAFPKPECDRAWTEELDRIRRGKDHMEGEIAMTEQELEQTLAADKKSEVEEFSVMDGLERQLSSLQDQIESRKRKFQEEREERRVLVEALNLKRARIQERMHEGASQGRTSLRDLKRRHYRKYFERLVEIFRSDYDVALHLTGSYEEDPSVFFITPNGSNRGLLQRERREEEEEEEEVMETGTVFPLSGSREEGEPLLDASQVHVRVGEEEEGPGEEQVSGKRPPAQKGPLYHSAPVMAATVHGAVAQKGPAKKGPAKKRVERELLRPENGMKAPRKSYLAKYGGKGKGKGPIYSSNPSEPTSLMRQLERQAVYYPCEASFSSSSEGDEEEETQKRTRRSVFSSSSSEESESSSSESSTSTSALSEEEYNEAVQRILVKYNQTGRTGSSPTQEEVGQLLRQKPRSKSRSDTPTKARKRSSKPGEEKNKRPLTNEEKRTIGHWNTLPEYNHGLLLDGVTCLWCNGRVYVDPHEPCVAVYTGGPEELVTPWFPTLDETMGEHWLWGTMTKRPCECRCYDGHTRKECYHQPEGRHGSGFFPTRDMDHCYETLRAQPNPEDEILLVKLHQYGNFRDSIRDFHKAQNEANSQQTDIRMVLVLTYSMRNNNFKKQVEQPRCPLCGYVDTRGDRALTLCRFCRGSGYVKARWNIWRDLVLAREKTIDQGENEEAWSLDGFRGFMKQSMAKQRDRLAARAARKKGVSGGKGKGKNK
jgi:hypothetical protein